MTLRPSARRSALNPVWRGIEWEQWFCTGLVWVSTSSVALVVGRVRKKSSGKAVVNRLSGGAAIACLVIGCGFVVYNNIIAASVYPTLGSAGYDEPVVKRPRVASRPGTEMISDSFA